MADVDLKERVLDIAYKNKLSHLGSYFSSLQAIDDIYSEMNLEKDKFILSCGHCALSLYAVLEKYYNLDAEKLFAKHGGHPHLCEVYVNVNGYAAYDSVDTRYLVDRLKVFLPTINIVYTSVNAFPFLKGLNAHYHVMSENDYKLGKKLLENEKTI